nr:MAG TPA: hypothetical protein [Caudoviricetes sp.]
MCIKQSRQNDLLTRLRCYSLISTTLHCKYKENIR